MRPTGILLFSFAVSFAATSTALAADVDTSTLPSQAATPISADWLIDGSSYVAGVYRTGDPREVILTNGLVTRRFRLAPNAATVALDNHMTAEAMLRGVKPEARLEIEGFRLAVGGLEGQPNYAFVLEEWLDRMTANPGTFQLAGFRVGKPEARFPWKRARHCEDRPWPPAGASLTLDFALPEVTAAQLERVPGAAAVTDAEADAITTRLRRLEVAIHYELYDGVPVMSKWLTIRNAGEHSVRVDRVTSEILAAVEYESGVEARELEPPNLHVETDMAFGGFRHEHANLHAVHWIPDPQYATQVNYQRRTPNLLEVRPSGPAIDLTPGETFESVRTFELIPDTTERERRGLTLRRMYRTIAPWITENPLMMHVRHADPAAVRLAIDQCAEVGFEMVILSFGSGFNMENEDPAYIASMKALAAYARSKGIEIGGYSLLSSRSIGPDTDALDPATGQPARTTHGRLPCLGSAWGQDYFRKLRAFIEKTGFSLLEHDGSYPGDPCASTKHPGHRDYHDSQWRMWKTISDFYGWCRSHGVYLNVPDYYYLTGSTKCGMGYRETNWSLPRAQQVIHARQNIYDGSWEKTPSMGWMFVPLTEYHGGGPAATMEPLGEHLEDYRLHLASALGLGVQACYRGPRLFDGPETRDLVHRWVTWFKKYRAILESDLIHGRRADGRDLDWMLHVNPKLREKGMLLVYNPIDRPLQRVLRVNLYYTGLTRTARIRQAEGPTSEFTLDRGYTIDLPVALGPREVGWFVIE